MSRALSRTPGVALVLLTVALGGCPKPNFEALLIGDPSAAPAVRERAAAALEARLSAWGADAEEVRPEGDGLIASAKLDGDIRAQLTRLLQDRTLALHAVDDTGARAAHENRPAPAGLTVVPQTIGGVAPLHTLSLCGPAGPLAAATKALPAPPERTWTPSIEGVSPAPPGARCAWLLEPAALDGGDIAAARVEETAYAPRPAVLVELTPAGGKRFAALTERITGRRLAIVVDGEVWSAPVVQERITGGRLQIAPGRQTPRADLDALAVALAHPPLPGGPWRLEDLSLLH